MIDLHALLVVSAAFSVVTISPGPANLGVCAVAMSAGRKPGIMFGFGLAAGLAFWGLVAATGLGALLQTTATALTALKVLGAVYLLWLALRSAKSALRASEQKLAIEVSAGKWFVQGLLLNVSNPKAVFAWMAALSVGLGVNGGVEQLAVATLVCASIGVANYIGHAALFSLPSARRLYARGKRWIEGAVAVLFAVAGVSLLRSALTRTS
ncbi:MAG: LysE family transporter [Pseudomonadota bacterium]